MARYQKTILPQGKRVKDMRFGFDRVFDETCTQQDVYESTTKSLLDSVLDGFNATVFAYGATGCGKTHTISGNPQHPGIIFLTCAELFERIDALADEKEIQLTLSYLEIYNETIRDLLVPGGSKLGLQLREDTNSNISVSGLSTHAPKTVEEVMDMIVLGNANRTQSPTEANATSSRSHAVLQINVTQKPRTAGLSEDHMASTLSIIDLAGSERASVTKNRGDRLLEGANINRSLLALGNCINSLCDPVQRNHVPYRDSKLTRLLKFSLGGNCKTVMIVCVSPSSQHYDETHNTLKYANRAKNIKTKVSRNIINVNRHVSEYVKAIYNLRQEVDSLKTRLKDVRAEAGAQLNKQRVAKDASIKEGLKRLRAAYEQSKAARDDRVQLLQGLRILERRISLVNSWLSAFDQVVGGGERDAPSMVLFNMRGEAEKVLEDLQQNEHMVRQRLNAPSWEKALDSALQNSLRNLQAIDGTMESDIAILNTEAKVLNLTAETDMLQAMNNTEVDVSESVQSLVKAHFETYATISKIMEDNIPDEEALERARKSLFHVQQGSGDAISVIVKPFGELVSTAVYHPPVLLSPKKKRQSYLASPVKVPNYGFSMIPPPQMSPIRSSPRQHIKHKSPKKGVTFNKKLAEKKRVRWNEELEDPVSEDSKRSRFLMNDPYYDPLDEEEDMPPPPPRPAFSARARSPPPLVSYEPEPASAPQSQGVMAPPIRPKAGNSLVGKSLAAAPKPREQSPPMADYSLVDGNDDGLNPYDTVDQVVNRLKGDGGSSGYSSSEEPNKPWRPTVAPTRGVLRKSIAGHGPIRPAAKRRSPTSSSKTSPEGTGQFKTGFTKRLPNKGGEKENTRSIPSVLSPHSTGIKASARRLTVSSGGLQLSALATTALQHSTIGRQSIVPTFSSSAADRKAMPPPPPPVRRQS